jgi:transposase
VITLDGTQVETDFTVVARKWHRCGLATAVKAATENPAGRQLRTERQRIGIPMSVLASSLDFPYRRLRRLEIGTRADSELEQRATLTLAQLENPDAA